MVDRCLIFGAGEHFPPTPAVNDGDFVIAVDGGYDYLLSVGITPDIIVGDFDSARAEPPAELTHRLPAEKDDTDMAAAIELAIEKGAKCLNIYGGTGGRLDHTLSNIQCLAGIAQRGVKGFIHGGDFVITAVKNGKLSFASGGRGTVSVFSHSELSTGVYERGLKYPLDNAVLKNTYPLGVSNELTGGVAEISVESGTLIIIYPQGTEII